VRRPLWGGSLIDARPETGLGTPGELKKILEIFRQVDGAASRLILGVESKPRWDKLIAVRTVHIERRPALSVCLIGHPVNSYRLAVGPVEHFDRGVLSGTGCHTTKELHSH